EQEDERRVADTFRVISLSFSNMGGPEAVKEFFASTGARGYEDRIYANLGEHYLGKLRYDDAAKTYRAFETLYPLHKAAPRFAMKVVETFTAGGFPKLVLEAKREFAAKYGLTAEYWRHFKPEESPEVLDYLKANLKDLATHYHAQYQGTEKADEKLAHYREALRWYGDYLTSFPKEVDSAPINYRMADLLLENKDFGEAARQYARTAYEYPAHPQSAAAGYAAVYAYRELLKVTPPEQQEPVKRDTVASSIKFADSFPEHQAAPAMLGAAADDLYEMKDYPVAVATAQRLLTTYAAAEPTIRRSAWVVVGHGSFELAQYPQAEEGYAQVLRLTAEDDASRAALVDNLAASIYKQGEQAKQAQDYRAAADHFLRIRTAAPTSAIRPTAEFDAGSALLELKDWTGAAAVLEAFRTAYPEHELRREATKQIAHAYRESGQLMHAADEYDRLAGESDDPAVRSEALLTAGDLYAQSSAPQRALDLYRRYVEAFPTPVEPALETRSKIADIHKTAHEDALYRKELEEIVRVDREAGGERSARTRTVAGRAALVLVEPLYQQCVDVKLRQPFEASLQEKKKRMDTVIDAMDGLVEYEIADVTAAATFYMAETYLDFSRSLKDSERPADLETADEAEYAEALETEAFPFEEKAIDFHQKNLEMMHAGVYNPWTEKSLDKLVELVPGRYARAEQSSGFLSAMDTYVYRSPVAQLSPLTLGESGSAPAPQPQEGKEVNDATPR
ncbi:MAG TPA: tetratricopeptide repeat protein, partial [Candidatus Polarisedimenticolaceae bacterium]|nr:tetratricopeptide repeat protein [Candidatus Polarisedimenticolaceae bacterium]